MFLGGLMGLERELAQKPAGLRTHMLVAGVSSLLIVLGDVIISKYGGSASIAGVELDPIRIIRSIITGISFLGAGTIIFRDQHETVEGLTTAASILFSAAIGMTVALQQYTLAAILTLIAIIILFGLGYIEVFLKRLHKRYYDDQSDD